MKMKLILNNIIPFIIALSAFHPSFAQQPEKVNLQLKWKHQFQFAGYYAAIEKGYYREAGIQVNLIEAVENVNPNDAVFDGKVEFGTSNSEIILERSKGKKPVVLATIFQHSPLIILASKKSGIDHVQDMIGKKISLEENSTEILAFLKDEGVKLEKLTYVNHQFNASQLISGEIDAISAYSTDEPFVLKQAKFDYTLISPIMGGIDFYGDILFTTQVFMQTHPALTEKFLKASLKGWQYAMNHPEEIVNLIYNKYSRRHTLDHLRFEAQQMKKLIMPSLIEIGYNNPGKWEAIANIYKNLNLIDQSFQIGGLLYNDHLKPKPAPSFRLIALFVVIAIFIAFIIYLFYTNNVRLKREILNRNIIEKELRENEQKYRILVENMTDGVYRSTHDGKFLDVNQAMLDILGYESKEELLSIDIKTELYFAEEERESAELVEKLEEMAVFRLKRKDGSEIWVEDHGRHVLDDDGNILYHEGTLRNVTERKLIEDALQRSEERYRTLIENMGEGVGFTNEMEVFIYANPFAEKIFGVEKGKLSGMSLWDFLSKDSMELIDKQIINRKSGKSGVYELEIIIGDGSRKDILVTATPSFNRNKFVGTFAIFHDITLKKKNELLIRQKNEELQKLNATKDKFFSIIAHDLKSPFNSIIGFSEILVGQAMKKDFEGIEKFARIILESSERAMELLMNLMEWSLSQTGRMDYNPQSIEYKDVIDELILHFVNIAEHKEISIIKNYSGSRKIHVDKAMFSTVLRNLISNAIKFTKPGGQIQVSVTENLKELTFSVKDNGIGIPENKIDKLFRIDENFTTPGTNKEKGTGLGLILCKEFIDKHHGKIWVDSESDKGSTFYFTIPII